MALIPIEDIIIKFNVRNELGDLRELVDSIKETEGVLNPLLVCKIPDSNQYELLAGQRRFAAAKESKLKVIECNIREAKNDWEKFKLMYNENLGRKELTWTERAKATKLEKEIAQRFNIEQENENQSERTTFRYLSAAKAIEDFPVLEKEESLSAALRKYRKIKELDLRTQLKLKNNEISLKQAIYIEKSHRVVREIDTGNLVIEELKKEVDHYKSNIIELAKQKNKEERVSSGILLFDEVKEIVKAARSCEAFGIKDIEQESCNECARSFSKIKEICDWWFEQRGNNEDL